MMNFLKLTFFNELSHVYDSEEQAQNMRVKTKKIHVNMMILLSLILILRNFKVLRFREFKLTKVQD